MVGGKRQHYVPQFYFRLFSNDGININTYNLKSRKYFRNLIRNQCSRDYFYTKNPEFEKSTSALEGKFSILTKKIIDNQDISTLLNNEYILLLFFILFQYSRTEKEKNSANEMTNIFFKEYMHKIFESNKEKSDSISIKDIDKIELKYSGGHFIKLFHSFTTIPLISDLTPILILNDTKENFIFSDSPVVFHNSYFNQIKDHGTKGLTDRGLEIFCPLNSKLMLMLYDSTTYFIDSLLKIRVKSIKDINSLNSLQFFYSKNIYFSCDKQVEKIKDMHVNLYDKIKPINLKNNKIKIKNNNGSYDDVPIIYEPNIDYELNLSFVKNIVDKSIKFEMRNPDIWKECKNFSSDFFQEMIRKNEKFKK